MTKSFKHELDKKWTKSMNYSINCAPNQTHDPASYQQQILLTKLGQAHKKIAFLRGFVQY